MFFDSSFYRHFISKYSPVALDVFIKSIRVTLHSSNFERFIKMIFDFERRLQSQVKLKCIVSKGFGVKIYAFCISCQDRRTENVNLFILEILKESLIEHSIDRFLEHAFAIHLCKYVLGRLAGTETL